MLAPVIPGRSLALATVAGVAAIGIAYCAFMSFQSDDGDSEEGESEDGDAGAKTEAAEDEGERATAPKEFMEAAKDDDARTVASFLAEGLPPDAISGKYDQTALCTAAAWGCVGVAQVLLDAGASVNLANAWGLTPLHLAAMNDRLELSKLLIQHGAYTKVRAGSTHGNLMPFEMAKGELQVLLGGFSNAMHRAIDSSDLDVLRRLMGEGIDLCEPDERGRTPLHAAAEAAGLLISEVDADGSERDVDQGLKALEILTQMAGDGVVQAACKTLNAQGLSALHSLVQDGHLEATALLLRSRADPNERSRMGANEYNSGSWGRRGSGGDLVPLSQSEGSSALHMAIGCDTPSHDMIRLLLEHGADPNLRDGATQTALHLALDFEEDRDGPDLELAELLLRHGADPSLGNNLIGMANSCVHAAVVHKNGLVLNLLLRHGAPHSTPGKNGWTPLALAARAGDMEAVAPLLAAGADPSAPTASGKSARDLATINKRAKVVEAFDSFGRSGSPSVSHHRVCRPEALGGL